MVKEYVHDEEIIQEPAIWDAMKQVDFLRNVIREELDDEEKSAFGQFFTPYPIAELMSSMLTYQAPTIRILDAGAGIGALFTAAVTALCQKDIILHAVKSENKPDEVITTTSTDGDEDYFLINRVKYDQVVQPDDPQSFIRIIQDTDSNRVNKLMYQFKTSLQDLGINVSTGRVVDFRALDVLHMTPQTNTVPLLYPVHLQHGTVNWPIIESKKPNAISDTDQTQSLLVPNQCYVLIKRFSSKEEKKRIVAVLYEPEQFPYPRIGFENHLNYFHQDGQGLHPPLAKGLTAYLNSELVDSYFRQFNGHTQVNATDLRNIKYPTRAQLEALGNTITAQNLNQFAHDELIKKVLLTMPENEKEEVQNSAKQKMAETLSIIKDLGLLRAQQNERSALTLLALLNLKPHTPWSQAENPLCGITPMMDFFREHYDRDYKPNTRETVRRQTVHQFLEAGLIEANPDRPINSPRSVYRVEQGALELLRTFGTSEWHQNLYTYLSSRETLQKRYAKEREMRRIPVTLAPGQVISLSPGGQNILVEKIIHEFAERYTPGGKVLYVGDTDEKFAYFDQEGLEELGVHLESHGKMPDVVIYYTEKNWLILIEAVTSHGPIDGKRKDELERLFNNSHTGLAFITAFLSRVAMQQYMKEIAWETDVWIAEIPSHLIHFNGERISGPYEKK